MHADRRAAGSTSTCEITSGIEHSNRQLRMISHATRRKILY